MLGLGLVFECLIGGLLVSVKMLVIVIIDEGFVLWIE